MDAIKGDSCSGMHQIRHYPILVSRCLFSHCFGDDHSVVGNNRLALLVLRPIPVDT